MKNTYTNSIKKSRHSAVHRHMHWAEGFLEIIQDIKN